MSRTSAGHARAGEGRRAEGQRERGGAERAAATRGVRHPQAGGEGVHGGCGGLESLDPHADHPGEGCARLHGLHRRLQEPRGFWT